MQTSEPTSFDSVSGSKPYTGNWKECFLLSFKDAHCSKLLKLIERPSGRATLPPFYIGFNP